MGNGLSQSNKIYTNFLCYDIRLQRNYFHILTITYFITKK